MNSVLIPETIEEQPITMIEKMFLPIVLGIAIILALAITWLFSTEKNDHFQNPASPAQTADTTTNTTAIATVNPEDSQHPQDSQDPWSPTFDSEVAKLPPPPPEVYWSVLTAQLFELEQERTNLLNLFQPPLPLPRVDNLKTVVTPVPISPPKETQLTETKELSKFKSATMSSPPLPPPASQPDITWTTVGNQLLELEQQREQTLTVLAN